MEQNKPVLQWKSRLPGVRLGFMVALDVIWFGIRCYNIRALNSDTDSRSAWT